MHLLYMCGIISLMPTTLYGHIIFQINMFNTRLMSNQLKMEGKSINNIFLMRNKWRETPYKYHSFKVEQIDQNGGKAHTNIIFQSDLLTKIG